MTQDSVLTPLSVQGLEKDFMGMRELFSDAIGVLRLKRAKNGFFWAFFDFLEILMQKVALNGAWREYVLI